jgi:hypothetical protein
LGRTRSATAATLDALERALAELEPPALPEGFWVVRGQEPILAQAHTYITQARRSLALSAALEQSAALEHVLTEARERGCRITQPLDGQAGDAATVLLVECCWWPTSVRLWSARLRLPSAPKRSPAPTQALSAF